MSHQAEMILDQIDVVKLDISLWSSSKKLRPEDLVLADGSKLPPEDLAYLGTKKTIDPDKLKGFNRIKKEAERICLECGVRFLGGFANPRHEIPRIIEALDQLAVEFTHEKDQFLKGYSDDTEDWILRHAEFGDAIRRALEPAASVAAKLRFDYVIFRVSAPKVDEPVPLAKPAVASLDRKTKSLSEQLFREIAQEAKEMIERSFVGKTSVTARILNAFWRMRNKLDSLGFLDHRCMPVVDSMDSLLVALPKRGPYVGLDFNSLFSLGQLLSDPDKIKAHGQGLYQLDACTLDDEEIMDDQIIPAVSESIQPVTVCAEVIDSPEDDLADFEAFMADYLPDTEVVNASVHSVPPENESVPEHLNSAGEETPTGVATTRDFWF
jgi:hypothetical protein